MQIQFFGLSSFKISSKEATIITDPFNRESGLTSPRGAAELVMLAEKNNELYTTISGVSGEPFIIDDPGGYDIKNVAVTGIPLKQDEGRHVTVFYIETEDIRILNLTHIREFTMKENDLEGLGDIDILILPVGGNSVMTPKLAAQVVADIEPKIVIPSHHQTDGLKLPYEKLEVFLKETGLKHESMEKLSMKKKDMTMENTSIIVLEPLR